MMFLTVLGILLHDSVKENFYKELSLFKLEINRKDSVYVTNH